MTATKQIAVGDYICIPAWNTIGRVTSIWDRSADAFSTDTSTTLLLESRGKEVRYRVEPGEFFFMYPVRLANGQDRLVSVPED